MPPPPPPTPFRKARGAIQKRRWKYFKSQGVVGVSIAIFILALSPEVPLRVGTGCGDPSVYSYRLLNWLRAFHEVLCGSPTPWTRYLRVTDVSATHDLYTELNAPQNDYQLYRSFTNGETEDLRSYATAHFPQQGRGGVCGEQGLPKKCAFAFSVMSGKSKRIRK